MAAPEPRRGGLGLAAAALLAAAVPAGAADGALGKQVFLERCSACHGEHGFGDGPAANAIVPRPRNFHDPEFWKGRTPEALRAVVEHGKGTTSMMPAFEGVLSDAQIDAVVDYLQSFRPAGAHADPGHGQVPGSGGGEDPPRPRRGSGGGG
ncbi:MAG TPA: cytochrome c [Candidatus Binatia bacterium]|nr:cytochrome c [Candidatus Binatia bacterium]